MLVHKVLEPLNNRLEAVKWGGGGEINRKGRQLLWKGFLLHRKAVDEFVASPWSGRTHKTSQ